MISQNLFQSIDTIISKRLHEVSFDITLICEVVEDTLKAQGQYTVKTDTMRFVAQGEENKYSVGQSVYVTVPQGNYSLQKVIIGAYNKDTAVPARYLRPLDYLLPMIKVNSFYYWDEYHCSVANVISSYPYLGIAFSVNHESKEGMPAETPYGIIVKAATQNNGRQIIGEFDSSEFFGNPYPMIGNFEQSKVFRLPEPITDIWIEYYSGSGDDRTLVKPEDIGINNIKAYLGSAEEDETEPARLEIIRTDSLGNSVVNNTVNGDTTSQLTLQAKYIFKDDNGKYQVTTPNVEWYRYTPGAGTVDEYDGGPLWGRAYYPTSRDNYASEFNKLDFINQYIYIVAEGAGPELINHSWGFQLKTLTLPEERFKARYRGIESEVFTVIPQQRDTEHTNSPEGSVRGLPLYILRDGNKVYNPSFNVYGIDNKLIIPVDENELKIYIEGISRDDIQSIRWVVPDSNTMIERVINTGLSSTLQFKLKDLYFPSFFNNTIKCELTTKNGIKYEGQIIIDFGYANTSGTVYRFNVDRSGSELTITLQDEQGQYYTWGDGSSSDVPITKLTTRIIQWSSANTPSVTSWTSNGDKVTGELSWTSGDYGIIAVYLDGWGNTNGTTINLVDYVVIPSKDVPLQGATRVVYNWDGMSASYDQRAYASNEEITNLSLNEDEQNVMQLNEDNTITLRYPAPTQKDNVVLTFTCEGEVIHYPILCVYNGFASDFFNNWNGKLTINEEDNYIMSAMVGAGGKDENGYFTGVVMGELKKAYEDDSVPTGLYGFHQGESRFRFLSNGDFYIGGGEGDGYIQWVDSGFTMQANALKISVGEDDDKRMIINSEAAGEETMFQIGSVDGDNKYIKMTADGSLDMNIGELDVTATSIDIQAGGFNLIGNSNAASMTIKSGASIIFQANSAGSAQIAGWKFDNNSMSYQPVDTTVLQDRLWISTGTGTTFGYYDYITKSFASKNGLVFGAGAHDNITIDGKTGSVKPFAVFQDGSVYCTKATMYGNIFATGGKIGDWEIVDRGFQFFYDSHTDDGGEVTNKGIYFTGNTLGVQDYEVDTSTSGAIAMLNKVLISGTQGYSNTYTGLYQYTWTYKGYSYQDHFQETSAIYFGANKMHPDDLGVGFVLSNHSGCIDRKNNYTMPTLTDPGREFLITGYTDQAQTNRTSYIAMSDDYLYLDIPINIYSPEHTTYFDRTVKRTGRHSSLRFYTWGEAYDASDMDTGIDYMVMHFTTRGIVGRFAGGSTSDAAQQGSWIQFYNAGGSTGGARLYGTWKSQNTISIDSDLRVKNSISVIPIEYSALFDNLNPVVYKYNNGTSNRFHTGFIAQEVKSALDIAGIDSQNFAGLCIPAEGAEGGDTWTLRYEEFIALNTSEIQKLKKRVASLEEEVTYLKNIISVTM